MDARSLWISNNVKINGVWSPGQHKQVGNTQKLWVHDKILEIIPFGNLEKMLIELLNYIF